LTYVNVPKAHAKLSDLEKFGEILMSNFEYLEVKRKYVLLENCDHFIKNAAFLSVRFVGFLN